MPRVAPVVTLNSATKARAGPTGAVALRGELHMPEVTVSKWRRNFVGKGLEGIEDAPRSGRPSKHSQEIVQRVQNRACQKPEHLSRWSVRTLAKDLALPRSTVHQILTDSGLQPIGFAPLHSARTLSACT